MEVGALDNTHANGAAGGNFQPAAAQSADQINGGLQNAPEAGLGNAVGRDAITPDGNNAELASLVSGPANDASYAGLASNNPAGVPAELGDRYQAAIDHGNLAAQTYNRFDSALADAGLALFSGSSDLRNQDFAVDGYTRLDDATSPDIPGFHNGLDYQAFRNDATGDKVVAFRGTEPLSAVDWANNVAQLAGNSSQYQGAVDVAEHYQGRVDDINAQRATEGLDPISLSFAGHSLGGGLATAAGLATGNDAYAFNAAGLSQPTINNLGLGDAIGGANDHIFNFNVTGDIVSDWNGRQDTSTILSDVGPIGPTHQYGQTYWLDSVTDSQINFGGPLVPDWATPSLVEGVANHAWHSYAYQLGNANFA